MTTEEGEEQTNQNVDQQKENRKKKLGELSLFSSLTIYSILNTYYLHYDNPRKCICVFNLTYSLQC